MPAAKAPWVLPAVLIAIIVTIAGGLAARVIYARPVETGAAAVVPVQQSLAPSEQPGDPTVMATKDARDHPLYETVKQLLQTYFDSINSKDYNRWQTVVSAQRAKKQPERDWRTAYRTTRDGSIVILRIESSPADVARVLLAFTSVQDPRDGPPEMPEPCIHWRLVFPLALESGSWKLDSGLTSSASQHDKC
jgi:hypothetical protein